VLIICRILLLPKFIDLCHSSSDDISRVALVVDARSRAFLDKFKPTLKRLETKGYHIKLIFLECSDDVLIQRFSETRRHHPSVDGGSVLDGVKAEREMLSEMKSQADSVIDTTDPECASAEQRFVRSISKISQKGYGNNLYVFGFKYGVPHYADIVLDVRFLPNPYFVEELKELTGNDEKVVDYVFNFSETKKFLEMTEEFLSFSNTAF